MKGKRDQIFNDGNRKQEYESYDSEMPWIISLHASRINSNVIVIMGALAVV